MPYSLAKLRDLSGSENRTAYSFRQKVRNAFEVIEEKSARYGELFEGEVGSDDLVRVRTKRAEGGKVRGLPLRPQEASRLSPNHCLRAGDLKG